MRLIFLVFLFLATLAPAFAGSPSADRPWVGWAEKVREVRLSNGMKFLIYPRGQAPIFTAFVQFRVGGLDEEDGKTGLAHFLEHMAFKGTKTIGSKGEKEAVARLYMENGAEGLNATTSKDATTYFVNLPSEKLEFWAWLESERIFHPVFREFDEEKNVVLEERRMRVDNNPDGQLYEKFLETAFQKSPYRWPTIGREEEVKKLTVQDLQTFWEKHYDPSHAVGVLVGQIDMKKVVGILEKTFGKIQFPTKHKEEEIPKEPPQKEERNFRLKIKERPRLLMGYHKPTLPHPDDVILDLVEGIMANGRSSRLYRKLVQDTQVASNVDIGTDIPGSRLENLFLVEVNLLGNHTPMDAIHLVDEELDRLKEEDVSPAELEKAKNQIRVNHLWQMETNEGMAAELAHFQTLAGDWHYLPRYLDLVDQVTAKDIRHVAQTYFQKKNRTIGVLVP